MMPFIEIWPGRYGWGLFRADKFRRLMLGRVTVSWFQEGRVDLRFPLITGLLACLTAPAWIWGMGDAAVGLIMTVIQSIFCIFILVAVQFHGSQR